MYCELTQMMGFVLQGSAWMMNVALLGCLQDSLGRGVREEGKEPWSGLYFDWEWEGELETVDRGETKYCLPSLQG